MAHRVDGVLVGYPIATPSLRISTRVPRDQRTPGPNSLGPVCPVPTVPSTVVTTIQIMVLERLYLKLAEKMTDREGHRTDTAYEDALIGKTFVFTFVNAYATFF